MAFWTYLLLCADGQYYTGHTDDLERRLGEHQSGLIKGFTSSRLPVTLVWADYFHSREEAIVNELRVKKWSKAKKRALAAQDWDALSYYSKAPKERGVVPMGVSSSLDTNGVREILSEPANSFSQNGARTC
jgi:putative endonuclease